MANTFIPPVLYINIQKTTAYVTRNESFLGMKASQKLNFNHFEVIINSAPDRKVILESTLLEQSFVEKGCGETTPHAWKTTSKESLKRPVFNEIWYT